MEMKQQRVREPKLHQQGVDLQLSLDSYPDAAATLDSMVERRTAKVIVRGMLPLPTTRLPGRCTCSGSGHVTCITPQHMPCCYYRTATLHTVVRPCDIAVAHIPG